MLNRLNLQNNKYFNKKTHLVHKYIFYNSSNKLKR